ISGLPGLENVRSISKFGFAQVVATFHDDTSIYDARQFIMERLNSVQLPDEIDRPQLGPISTGLGEVLHYIVHSDNPDRDLTDLRTIHDWVIKPALLTVPGTAEVNSWGGYEKQYHVVVNPEALVKYGLSLSEIEQALRANNLNVGGGQIERSGESLLVHGLGRVSSIPAIEGITITAYDGTPVHISDIAEVVIGHEIRRGAVTFQGKGEAVLGLGFMLMGENSQVVTENLRKKLESIRLPDDILVDIVYDRTDLVDKVISTVSHNLMAGAILVIVVLFVLLGNVRAGLLVAFAIPMAMLFAVLGMYEFSIAASLLSLGAIDFGIIVDGSVVMTDANLRRLRSEQERLGRKLTAAERLEVTIASSREIARPIVFGMGIIIVVFLPILTLEGLEGKMFRPMALSFIFALVGALFVALFLSPIGSYYLLPRKAKPERKGLVYFLTKAYAGILRWALRGRWLVLGGTAVLFAVSANLATQLGGEFVPRLSEGSVVANVIRLAGVSIETSTRYNTRIENILLDEFPDEIEYVWSRIGTAEVATDPMGIELTDIFFSLHPRDQWTKAKSQSQLVSAVEETLSDLPGINIAYTQPIEMRLNEMVSGIRSDVGIKIYGDDFEELIRVSDNIQKVLLNIEGASDISADQLTGQPSLQVKIREDQIARYGIPRADVLDFVRAVGGIEVGKIYEGQRVFPLVIRMPDAYRADPERLATGQIPTGSNARLQLQQVAELREVEAPSTINREWGRRLIRVQVNVRDRDISGFVKEAQRRIEAEVSLPDGYVLDWGGQFENLQRARTRLAIIVPTTLVLIFFLLYFSLGKLRDVFIIYTGIPFAFIGGVAALWWRGIPFSVSAAVGFIALCGIAVLNGQVLVAAIRTFQNDGLPTYQAVIEAGKQRLRPVLATGITDAVGFLPMALSVGVGAEVQRPLATVVVGGILSATLLTLIVLPILYIVAYRATNRESDGKTESIR
ncbi:efflux RND transporter permease subunit, partial [bacterium AH-315-P07]|nr:efflux RND transporter permease subunit [bacterium AH-315-P07]